MIEFSYPTGYAGQLASGQMKLASSLDGPTGRRADGAELLANGHPLDRNEGLPATGSRVSSGRGDAASTASRRGQHAKIGT